MKLFGSKPHLPTIICIYGYSLSSFIPACLISMIPNTTLHIIIFGYATFASTSFSIANYWKDASQYINSRKYFLIAIILIFQIVMYLVIVLYFFGMTKEVQIVKEKIEEIKNITGIGLTNSTLSNSTESTGLL